MPIHSNPQYNFQTQHRILTCNLLSVCCCAPFTPSRDLIRGHHLDRGFDLSKRPLKGKAVPFDKLALKCQIRSSSASNRGSDSVYTPPRPAIATPKASSSKSREAYHTRQHKRYVNFFYTSTKRRLNIGC